MQGVRRRGRRRGKTRKRQWRGIGKRYSQVKRDVKEGMTEETMERSMKNDGVRQEAELGTGIGGRRE